MTASELRAKFEKDLEELQFNCTHPEYEEMEESYAPGHFTGRIVKVCTRCDKVL